MDDYTSIAGSSSFVTKLRKIAKMVEDSEVEVSNGEAASASDWGTNHEANERTGGLIFGTPGLLSLQFVVASLASIASVLYSYLLYYHRGRRS